ncbi:unnamed protein product, partial [Ectocarpus sp. 12 AP-2014]
FATRLKHVPVQSARRKTTAMSQPSILSFFGKGGRAAPSSAAGKEKTKAKPRQATDGACSAAAGGTAKPTARRRKAIASKEKEASAAVDLTAAPSAPIEAAARALEPEKRQRPRRAVRSHDGGGGDSSNPAAAAAATITPSSKTKPRRRKAALAPASCEDSDAPSPETDSETSPAVLPEGEARPAKRSRVGRACGKRSSEGNGRDDHTVEEMEEEGVVEDPELPPPGNPEHTSRLREKDGEREGVEPNNNDQEGEGKEGVGSDASNATENTDGEGACVDEGLPISDARAPSRRGGEDEGGSEEEGGKGELSEDKRAEPKKINRKSPGNMKEEAGGARAGGISQYELERLERIERNQAFMATLGLVTAKPFAASAATSSEGTKGRNKNKKRSRPVSRSREKAATVVPVRRSARGRGAEAVDYNEDKQAINAIATAARAAAAAPAEPEPTLEEIDFDDSTVLKYLCGTEANVKDRSGNDSSAEAPNTAAAAAAAQTAAALAGTGAASAGATVMGLRVIDPDYPLSASGLSTIYTMHFCGARAADGGGGGRGAAALPPLLAAGGKGGVVALFSTRRRQQTDRHENNSNGEEEEEEDERTLMNFKAHKGWVSAVRFLEGGGAGAGVGGCRLLTSANDSMVKLWDTSKQHRGLPRLLSTMDDLHPTRKGIFAMDSHGTRVATGSKDTTVAIASLRPTGIEHDRVLGDPGGSEAFHEKVVKGVSLRDENTVASCGDDSNLRVSDLRSSSSFGVSQRLDGVHGGRACHTVRWHPLDDNLLLSAGLDSTVNLYDLRRLAAPLHVFRGHCPYALAR